MKLEVTRDVVNDLWPLYQSGEVSTDSRALIDAFLSSNDQFAASLQESDRLNRAMPTVRLSPDAERRLLHEASERARLKLLVIGGAIGLAGFLALAVLVGLLYFRSSGI